MKRTTPTTLRTGVIIPAAGSGTRMGGPTPKQLLLLAGKPVLAHTCAAFLAIPAIEQLVIAVHPDHAATTRELLLPNLSREHHPRIRFTPGGASRQDSVQAGLTALDPEIELILVHDAARPLIDRETILRTIQGAAEHGAVIAAIPVKDTLKQAAPDQIIQATVDRSHLWQAQTPQAARRALLQEAMDHAARSGFQGTDEASLLEHHGLAVRLVEGNEQNLKITRPGDLQLAQHLLSQRAAMKIGHGFDAHRLVADRRLILGGVTIDYQLGLAGHSDADVVCHALTDAVLGAMGAGDIGRHFPDNDEQYRNISSILLLDRVMAQARQAGLELSNADITILCQQPKLAPHLKAMQEHLAASCGVAPQDVNIKATTTEQMGYTGRGEGIACHAVVLMRYSNAG
ncbi:2-C-methyl-D-erythritol 4-phosphate cytidylyltransferase [Desulfogranum mediterraneum]|uniref:2-C-methyl-D-erythritol 4-phosphate cytidylyltransferase n=1 Tax=Desulfogranum mediterraneum TaxID=160661 RepID=UPI00048D4778|nr:2-C-methyl-D-erythritol 4-phosphate cytidylyltransferase [Desulfogranum mediterraneum]